jgi:fused signal recognition particle receptor
MKSIFRVFQHGLQRTKTSIFRHIRGLFDDVDNWNEESYERLESALISADLGVDVSLHIVQEIRTRYERGLIRTEDDILRVAHEDLVTVLTERQEPPLNLDAKPAVVLMVGVNGSGKTTTAAKLAHLWKSDGRSVLLAACDTFRAAGTEQLRLWADRVGCPVVAGSKGGDAAAVAYDAVASARQRGADTPARTSWQSSARSGEPWTRPVPAHPMRSSSLSTPLRARTPFTRHGSSGGSVISRA